jgi:hypothetical protein
MDVRREPDVRLMSTWREEGDMKALTAIVMLLVVTLSGAIVYLAVGHDPLGGEPYYDVKIEAPVAASQAAPEPVPVPMPVPSVPGTGLPAAQGAAPTADGGGAASADGLPGVSTSDLFADVPPKP